MRREEKDEEELPRGDSNSFLKAAAVYVFHASLVAAASITTGRIVQAGSQ